MRKAKGVYILDSKEIESNQFEGVVICKEKNSKKKVIVKKVFSKEGEYEEKTLFIEGAPDGIGIKMFKKILLEIITEKNYFGFQIPEIAITEEAMKIIEG